MDSSLRRLLQLLIVVVILSVIAVVVWLFYCRCLPWRRAQAPAQQPLNTATVSPNRAEGGKYPPFTPKHEGYNEDRARTVPNGPLRGTLAPTSAGSKLFQLQQNKQNPPLGGAGDPVVFSDYDNLGTKASTVGTPPDLNAARNGNVVMFSYNTNLLLSTDGTASYKLLNPTTIFPSGPAKDSSGNPLDAGLCCDQRLIYVPQIDRFIWLMQFCGTGPSGCLNGINKVRIAAASTQDVITSNGTSWTYWDLFSSTFGLGTTTMDYPDLSVGDNFLYFSADAVGNGLLVVRIPLSDISKAQSIGLGYTTPSDSSLAYGGHISQNTGDGVFWAGHKDNSTIRIFNCPENSNQYFWRDVAIKGWPNGTISSVAPDGKDWLSFSFPGNAVLGVTRRTGNEVWFAWTASSNANFKNAQIQVLEINTSNYSVILQWEIWNNDYAFAYPSLATNSQGEVGISLGWGGKAFYGNNAVGILGDFIVWYPELSDAVVASNPIRYGDYFSAARNTPNSLLFDGSGYAVFKNTAPATGTRFDPYYIQFGRNSVINGGSPVPPR
jgi:hypothetical protein